MAEVLTKNANLTPLSVEEPGNQGEKRALPGTVKTQKHGEFPWPY
jgi:hypothetical protein